MNRKPPNTPWDTPDEPEWLSDEAGLPRRGPRRWGLALILGGLVIAGWWGWHRWHRTPDTALATTTLQGQVQWGPYGTWTLTGKSALIPTTHHVTVQNAALTARLTTGHDSTMWTGLTQMTARISSQNSTGTTTEGTATWVWRGTLGPQVFQWGGQSVKATTITRHGIHTVGRVSEAWTWNHESGTGTGVWQSTVETVNGVPAVVGVYYDTMTDGSSHIESRITYQYTTGSSARAPITLTWTRVDKIVRPSGNPAYVTSTGRYHGAYLSPWMMAPPYPVLVAGWLTEEGHA